MIYDLKRISHKSDYEPELNDLKIFEKCSQNDQKKIRKNYFKCILYFQKISFFFIYILELFYSLNLLHRTIKVCSILSKRKDRKLSDSCVLYVEKLLFTSIDVIGAPMFEKVMSKLISLSKPFLPLIIPPNF